MNLAKKLEIYNFKVFSYGSTNCSVWNKYVYFNFMHLKALDTYIENYIYENY